MIMNHVCSGNMSFPMSSLGNDFLAKRTLSIREKPYNYDNIWETMINLV